MKYFSQQMAVCVAEDAKSSECMDAAGRRGGIFGQFRYDGVGQLSWVSEEMMRSKGVWKQILTHVACAEQGSYGPERQGLHGIMTLNINNVRKDKA